VTGSLIGRLAVRDIASAVSRGAFERGQQYWRQKRVLSLQWDEGADGEATILSSVRGSAWVPYDVDVAVEEAAGGSLLVHGECSCPVGVNCKHVVAVLFAAIAEASKRPVMLHAIASPEPVARPVEALSSSLSIWVDELARLDESDSEEYPPEIRQRLIYLLDVKRYARAAARLVVSPVSTRLLKDETFSVSVQSYNPAAALQPMPAKFLRPPDRAILRNLELLSRGGAYSTGLRDGSLAGEEGVAILEAIIATGRARWRAAGGPEIVRGRPRRAQLTWRLGDDAAQHPDFQVEGDETLQVVALAPPWYVDEATGVVGPLETDLSPRLAAALLSAPPVPAGESTLLREVIEARLPAIAALVPPELPPPEEVRGPPIPRLTLLAAERYQPYAWRASPNVPVPVARLSFLYGSAEIGERDDRPRPAIVHDGRVFNVVRNRRLERQAQKLLRDGGFGRLSAHSPFGLAPGQRDDLTLPPEPGDGGWLDFLSDGVSALQEMGWDVVIEPAFPIRLVRAVGPLEADLHEGSGIDWLELDLGVVIDAERFDLTPVLLKMITDRAFDPDTLREPPDESEMVYVPLPDGRILGLPATRIWRIVCALYELFGAGLFGPKDTALRFSPLDAPELARTEAATSPDGIVWRGGERLRQLGEMLRAADGIPHVAVPGSFNATLRPYQASGVDWLQFLGKAGLGAVLADDMGLGKTVQTLAHLLIEKESGRLDRPALIVSPTSVVPNWRQEAARFAPGLKVLVLQGTTRKERFGEIAAHDLVITTYPLLARDRATLSAQEWHVVVLDEAQAIKNPDAIAARQARELRARQRLCLTGTPVENHLGELWSLFSFLSPGFLGDRQRFNRTWRRPIETEGNEERRRQLARRVRPFLLRRTKAEVLTELPPKTEVVERVEMEPAQRDVYESVRLAMHERVRQAIAAQGLARSQIVLLDSLLKLRQACCDPRLLKLETTKAARARSAKLDRLMEMLPALIEDGRRILLFSQFTSMLALIETALREAGIDYVLLTGDTRDRETPIRTFQSGAVPLFLISLKAGGVGLNLTAADTVILYDPWWNPAVEEQAADRAHRIGQEKPVFVYRLVALASIEEKMEVLKARKRDLAAGIFDTDGGSALELTEADVEELFAKI